MSLDCLCSLVIQRVTDADLIALVSDEVFQPEAVWKLLDMQVNTGAGICFLSLLVYLLLRSILILVMEVGNVDNLWNSRSLNINCKTCRLRWQRACSLFCWNRTCRCSLQGS